MYSYRWMAVYGIVMHTRSLSFMGECVNGHTRMSVRTQIWVALLLVVPSVSGWVTLFSSPHRRATIAFRLPSSALDSQILDVDFERVDGPSPPNQQVNIDNLDSSKTLFDLSLDSDPDWKEARVPFVDGENYIDAKLAFMAEMDGVSYGIGIPFDQAVVLTFESSDGSISNLSPDDDKNEELMQIMAAQLQEHLGKDLMLKRTPRVLTVAGPLDNYTKDWKEDILPDALDVDSLLDGDDADDDLAFFHKFMKEELGQEEYEKTLRGNGEGVSEEIMSLFDIPGLGTNKDDIQGMEEMLKSVLDTPENQLKNLEELGGSDFEHDGVALKLVSYILPGGKAYSLAQLMKPYVLVGKLIEAHDDTYFELLSPEDAQIVVPRLEKVCREDFVKAGLSVK